LSFNILGSHCYSETAADDSKVSVFINGTCLFIVSYPKSSTNAQSIVSIYLQQRAVTLDIHVYSV